MISIGKLSERTGLKVATIRYYEDIALVSKPARSNGKQRIYKEADVALFKFIRHARELGLKISDIRELLSLVHDGTADCQPADHILLKHLAQIRAKISALQGLEQELQRIATCNQNGTITDCNIIRSISDHSLCDHDH